MNFIMRLWAFIKRVFCGKKSQPEVEPKPKTKRLKKPKGRPSKRAPRKASTKVYTLTKEDWNLLESEDYFINLSKGLACRRSRNREVLTDNLMKYFIRDPEFRKRQTEVTDDPRTIMNKRMRNTQVRNTNRRIIGALVEHKEYKYPTVRAALEGNGMHRDTYFQKRTPEERDELERQAHAVFLKNREVAEGLQEKADEEAAEKKTVDRAAKKAAKIAAMEAAEEAVRKAAQEAVNKIDYGQNDDWMDEVTEAPKPKVVKRRVRKPRAKKNEVKKKWKQTYDEKDIEKYEIALRLISDGMTIADSWVKADITKSVFYAIKNEDMELNRRFQEAKVRRRAVTKAQRDNKKGASPEELAKATEIAQETLAENEVASIMRNEKAAGEMVDRIELALLEHSDGVPLKAALSKYRVDEPKFYQYRRLNIGNIESSAETAETDYRRIQDRK